VADIFELITRKFQLKFKDRVTAGNILGESLKGSFKKEEQKDIVVLGIPRGGMITADVVARKLSASVFDIIIPRKLTNPDNKEHAIGAIMEDGSAYLDEWLINLLQITPEYLEKEKAEQIREIRRRSALYYSNMAINYHELFKDMPIILVDDGAATGATLIAAARWLKRRITPKRLIIAVPVAPKDTVKLLKQEVDVVEAVTSISSTFRSVGQFYQDFNPVPDEKVIEILRTRNMLI
ncbi:MAG: phosphoribosyltransferase family protein, partial [Nitrososphaeraceae archaeon]